MTPSTALVLRDVQLDGQCLDVLVDRGRVERIAPRIDPPRPAEVVDAQGAALLPGLHDHHVHLLAIAAAASSVDVSEVSGDRFVRTLRDADATLERGGWMRVIGYHESVHGALDRRSLDEAVRDRPVRVQHATGEMWVLNSMAIDVVDGEEAPAGGVERDEQGIPTGRLFGLDDWLRTRWPPLSLDLSAVGDQLARFGISGVTDATPYPRSPDLGQLRAAVVSGAIAQRVVISGAPGLDRTNIAPLVAGPAKVLVEDHDPPDLDALADQIASAHDQQLPVALHCASRLGLVLGIAALEAVGAAPGDRIEHGAVVPPELFERLRGLHVTIVTQPSFVYTRGDRYLSEVEPEDLPHLWRCSSLEEAGIPVGFGSDAPHGPLDPWMAIRAAAERRTRAGRVLGTGERMGADRSLAKFLAPWHDPGGRARRLEVGVRADLCLLDAPVEDVLRAPSAERVRLTIIQGSVVWP
jgi:predicted amidohydrolase YtcJ